MFTSFIEAFLTRNGHICTAGIIGESRPNHSRVFPPGMNKDIFSGNNVRTTVRSDVQIADKINTTVEAFTTDKQDTASSQIVECAPKSIFVK